MGFFLTTTGDYSICQIGFTQDANKQHQVRHPAEHHIDGGDGAFTDRANWTPCSSACKTCTADASNNCVECTVGTCLLNGVCVHERHQHVHRSSLIANSDRR
ncbi:hypothetical protein DFH07DRAFT_811244 [Mycena maculata]|uniref:Uncharacterized protein n=1 Tax=Mycena maculata TaxID=230809 RepID=A0AAD7JHN7_9AGAR|nr:hypothetical protein DFH07DRAFT_811244 [Mycena maculata]